MLNYTVSCNSVPAIPATIINSDNDILTKNGLFGTTNYQNLGILGMWGKNHISKILEFCVIHIL